nr:hypothetical protein [Haliscomenobacter sp.]
MSILLRYIAYDILRNRMIIAYTLFLLLMSATMFSIESNPGKGLLNLLNIVLIVVPLVSIIFSTIHYYNSYEFIELLLAQPIPRKRLAFGQFLGWVCTFAGFFDWGGHPGFTDRVQQRGPQSGADGGVSNPHFCGFGHVGRGAHPR